MPSPLYGYCYNILYNESTSAFYKHGTATLDLSAVEIHDCGFYVDNDPTNNALMNTSADIFVTSANTSATEVIATANAETSGIPDIDVIVGEDIDMRLKLVIEIISPVVKTEYAPLDKVEPDSVVTR